MLLMFRSSRRPNLSPCMHISISRIRTDLRATSAGYIRYTQDLGVEIVLAHHFICTNLVHPFIEARLKTFKNYADLMESFDLPITD